MCCMKSNFFFFPKALQNQALDKNTREAVIDLPAKLCIKRTFFSAYLTYKRQRGVRDTTAQFYLLDASQTPC